MRRVNSKLHYSNCHIQYESHELQHHWTLFHIFQRVQMTRTLSFKPAEQKGAPQLTQMGSVHNHHMTAVEGGKRLGDKKMDEDIRRCCVGIAAVYLFVFQQLCKTVKNPEVVESIGIWEFLFWSTQCIFRCLWFFFENPILEKVCFPCWLRSYKYNWHHIYYQCMNHM